MEIKRIDPYLVEWSVDGAVAIASETGGVQLLVPDAVELLNADIQWRRMRSPDLAGRVLSMKWSPTGLSAYLDCVLACILDTGDAIVLEDSSGQTEPWSLRPIAGDYSACAWFNTDLILAASGGLIQAVNGPDLRPLWTTYLPSPGRVLELSCSETQIGALLEDNSVWSFELSSKRWEQVVEPSRFRVFGLQFGTSAFLVARTDSVFSFCNGTRKSSELTNYTPGHLLVCEDEWIIVHVNGQLSRAVKAGDSKFRLPDIKGRVFGAMTHPYLPIGLFLLGPVTTDWEYPIVSWQWAKTAFFNLPRQVQLPRITKFSAQIYWLTLLVSEKQPPALDAAANGYKRPPPSSSEAAAEAETEADTETEAEATSRLQIALEALFTSEWFDAKRLEWFLGSPDTRPGIVASMRSEIARLVCSTAQETPLDRAIARWYSAYLHPDYAAPKDEEAELLVLSLKGDSVDESFIVEPEQNDSVTSQAGHVWKRCSLTLVPLLSLNTRVSLDHEFSAYKTAPGDGAIAQALLNAGRLCVYTGTQWERPRF